MRFAVRSCPRVPFKGLSPFAYFFTFLSFSRSFLPPFPFVISNVRFSPFGRFPHFAPAFIALLRFATPRSGGGNLHNSSFSAVAISPFSTALGTPTAVFFICASLLYGSRARLAYYSNTRATTLCPRSSSAVPVARLHFENRTHRTSLAFRLR